MQTIDELIALLKAIVNCEEIEKTGFLTDGCADELHPLINEASNLACDYLIDANGNPDFTNHRILSCAGFPVHKGESDSFGWLSGVIATPKGRIVYG